MCHSRAANWLLGVSTAQINTVKRDNTVALDQLADLERLGAFRVSWLDHWRQWKSDVQASRQLGVLLARQVLASFGCLERIGFRPVQWIEQSLNDQPTLSVSLLPKRAIDYARLANPADVHETTDRRLRAYLHSNCASCHIWAGGGNSLIDLSYATEQAKMNVVGRENRSTTAFGRADALLVVSSGRSPAFRSFRADKSSRPGPNAAFGHECRRRAGREIAARVDQRGEVRRATIE